MEVKWFGREGSLSLAEKKKIEGWLKENAEGIHDIYHLVQEYKMEAFKIIDGTQDTDEAGKIRITSNELYVLPEDILIVKSEETQSSEKMESIKSMKYLAKIEIPCDEEHDEE